MTEIILSSVTFEIKVTSGNAAILDNPKQEVIRILQKAIQIIDDLDDATGVGGVVKDLNGNTIGDWGLYVSTTQQDEEGDIELPFTDVNL